MAIPKPQLRRIWISGLFADKAWVRRSWSGVGISSASDSYSVIPSELLGDTNKQGGRGSHYVVVSNAALIVLVLFARIVSWHRVHRLGSDVGINGVEGIFTTSNYKKSSAFEFSVNSSKVVFFFSVHTDCCWQNANLGLIRKVFFLSGKWIPKIWDLGGSWWVNPMLRVLTRREYYIHSNPASQCDTQVEWSVLVSFEKGDRR